MTLKFWNITSQNRFDHSVNKKGKSFQFPALSHFRNQTISNSIQTEIENGYWHWKLSLKCYNLSEDIIWKSFHKWDKIKPQYAASSFIRMNSQNRTANFADSLRFTQNEPAGDFYTIGKLWMSSFECHKWHSILTFVQRVMFK